MNGKEPSFILHLCFGIAELAAVFLGRRVGEVELMGIYTFDGSDAAWVLEGQDAGDFSWKFYFLLLDNLAAIDDGDGQIGIDKTQNIQVQVDDIVDFDDIFAAQLVGLHIEDQCSLIVNLVKFQFFEDLITKTLGDVVDDDTFSYTCDFQHINNLLTA